MSEARLLSLVASHPHPTSLARSARDGTLLAAVRLEDRGLVTRRRGLYRLTDRGRNELGWSRALAGLLARSAEAPA